MRAWGERRGEERRRAGEERRRGGEQERRGQEEGRRGEKRRGRQHRGEVTRGRSVVSSGKKVKGNRQKHLRPSTHTACCVITTQMKWNNIQSTNYVRATNCERHTRAQLKQCTRTSAPLGAHIWAWIGQPRPLFPHGTSVAAAASTHAPVHRSHRLRHIPGNATGSTE